jgi:hypothetical protein
MENEDKVPETTPETKDKDPLEGVRKSIDEALKNGVKGEDIVDAVKQMLHSDDEEHEEDKDAVKDEDVAKYMGYPGFAR